MRGVFGNGMTKTWRSAPWFFAAHLQSALGTGAAYVALLVLAYDRVGSAWGATAVLLADLAPAMLLGPLLGRLVDRTSRLGCAVAADLRGRSPSPRWPSCRAPCRSWRSRCSPGSGARCCAPRRARCCPPWCQERLGAANALFGAVREIGQLAGPVCAAALLALVRRAQPVLVLNAVTFAASAAMLTRLRGRRPVAEEPAEAPRAASCASRASRR